MEARTGQPSPSQFALLTQQRFAPFFWTQFFGAFNNNLFKNALIVLVTYHAARYAGEGSPFAGVESGVLVNLAAGLFILPFVLFSATAGQIADKYDQAALIRAIKAFEIAVMALAAWGLVAGNLALLLGALFLSGTQSTLFGPIKYSILPHMLRETELVGGNALVESGTFIAILAGTITGGYLASLGQGAAAASVGAVAVALLGFAASWFIPKTGAADPGLAIDWNPVRETLRNFRFIRGNRTVFLSILGISWFWLYGALVLSQLPDYAKSILQGSETTVTVLLATFSVGVGVGSLLCERLSGHKVEIGLVPLGSIGLTIFGADLYLESRTYLDLFLMGVFGGFYIVPLYALIQSRTPKSHLSRVVAGNNILNAVFMAVGALFAIAMIRMGFSVTAILLAAALLNALVAVYIYTLVPEFLMRFMVWILVHTVYRVRRAGLERVPDDGPAVIVCNHVSYVDALVITAACRRPIRWVMDHRIFRIPFLSFFFRTVRAIPIAPAKEDPEGLKQAYDAIAAALEAGDLVGLFPEGRLTADGEMSPFRPGIAQIVARTPVPVIPMALSGLWESVFARNPERLRNAGKLLYKRISLAVGDPVSPGAATPEHLHDLVLDLRGDGK
ncbi:MAG TPA: MFS transporter [Burkholderiales bacterium]|nr:MFS transporter [Burkholderiales bacterium]